MAQSIGNNPVHHATDSSVIRVSFFDDISFLTAIIEVYPKNTYLAHEDTHTKSDKKSPVGRSHHLASQFFKRI